MCVCVCVVVVYSNININSNNLQPPLPYSLVAIKNTCSIYPCILSRLSRHSDHYWSRRYRPKRKSAEKRGLQSRLVSSRLSQRAVQQMFVAGFLQVRSILLFLLLFLFFFWAQRSKISILSAPVLTLSIEFTVEAFCPSESSRVESSGRGHYIVDEGEKEEKE